MTRFEEIGAGKIATAYTPEFMERAFARSCDICCFQNRNLDCDCCAINREYERKKKEFAIQGRVFENPDKYGKVIPALVKHIEHLERASNRLPKYV